MIQENVFLLERNRLFKNYRGKFKTLRIFFSLTLCKEDNYIKMKLAIYNMLIRNNTNLNSSI